MKLQGFVGVVFLLVVTWVCPASEVFADSLTQSFFNPAVELKGSPVPSIGTSGLFPVHGKEGCEMALLTNGEASFRARFQKVDRAKVSIRIQALIWRADATGLALAKKLKEAKKKNPNLIIRVIVDALSNLDPETQWMHFDLKMHGIDVEGYEAGYLQAMIRLDEPWFHDPWNEMMSAADKAGMIMNKRFHDKLFIIDGEEEDGVSISGGLNIADEYARFAIEPKNRWRDQDNIVRGAIVKNHMKTFDDNFDYLKEIKRTHASLFPVIGEIINPALDPDNYWKMARKLIPLRSWLFSKRLWGRFNKMWDFIRIRPDKGAATRVFVEYAIKDAENFKIDFIPVDRARLVRSRPRFGETYIHQEYLEAIRLMKKGDEILIANAYFVPHPKYVPDLLAELVAASRRGVKVVILTNSDKTNDLKQLTYLSRDHYQALLDANNEPETKQNGGLMEIWEWHGKDKRTGIRDGTLHAKFAVFIANNPEHPKPTKYLIDASYNLDPRSYGLNSETAMLCESMQLGTELERQFKREDLRRARRITFEEAVNYKRPDKARDALKVLTAKPFTRAM